MEIEYTKEALSDIKFWKKSGNKTIQNKITELLDAIIVTPYDGIGRPEELKQEFAGYWSRIITKEHRLVYCVDEENQVVTIYSLKGHY